MFKLYSQLTKFGIVIFVLLAGIAGYAAGFFIESSFDFKHFLKFLMGLYFLSSGSLALNQVQEYKLDQKMPRTKNRPIASGKIKPLAGLIISICMLAVGVNALFELSTTAGWVGVSSVILYNVFYTIFWKPRWVFAAVPGAIPGALPVTIGYAVNNPNIFNTESIYLFLIMFLWQMPHFWLISLKFIEDYRLGGFPTLPVTVGVERTHFHIGLYTFAYAGVALASPFFLNSSWLYLLLILPIAFVLLKKFFEFFSSRGQKSWLSFFMWTNISMLVFIYIPAVEKWLILFMDRS